jgi:Domain of unknown function (DUF4438)
MTTLVRRDPVLRPRQDAPRINARRLVQVVVAGQVSNPLVRTPYRIGRDGVLRVVPGNGGIVLNVRVGDRACGLAGDHVEPGVSLRNNDRESHGPRELPNRGLMFYSCVGNRARVTSGPATGSVGAVTGKHGGINHVIVDFAPEVLRKMRIGDRVQIESIGQGMELRGVPEVHALNLSPRLLGRWGCRVRGRALEVPVTHIVPAGLMGSGLGKSEGVLGDTDIQLSDARVARRFRLDTLRLGDLVAVCPLDYRYGASFRGGAVTIGVVVHSDSHVAGHGPGVTPLLMSTAGAIRPVYSPSANIALLLGLRRSIAPAVPPSEGERARIWQPQRFLRAIGYWPQEARVTAGNRFLPAIR